MFRRVVKMVRLRRKLSLCAGAAACLAFAVGTISGLRPLPDDLRSLHAAEAVISARGGNIFPGGSGGSWNSAHLLPLWKVPPFFIKALLFAEDKRFFEHSGVDWRARASAVLTNLRALRAVRGASTITEQVVKMIHPRQRTV